MSLANSPIVVVNIVIIVICREIKQEKETKKNET